MSLCVIVTQKGAERMERLSQRYLEMPYEDIPEQALDIARASGRRVVAIGGGTGLSTLLLGLKEYTENITAIVTVTDDGGGSGILRREFGILPPGDIRNCVLALANTSNRLGDLLNYRFDSGSLEGQSFGNLFVLALNNISGSFAEAVTTMNQILAVTGQVLPVTNQNVDLEATFADGSHVIGETSITAAKKEHNLDIRSIALTSEKVTALPQAIEAIEEAELILLGPGSLYTSVIPNLLVGGVAEAIQRSKALKVYVLNVMTQEGETEGYSAAEHVQALLRHGGQVDVCLYNTKEIPQKLAARYMPEGSEPLMPDAKVFREMGIRLFGGDMLSRNGQLARHDPLRLAYTAMLCAETYAHRDGTAGDYDRLLLRKG